MFKNRKGLYGFMLCGLLSCATILTGCQQSPEGDIVVNKNEGVLEEAIKDSSGNSEVLEETPETYTDTFELASQLATGEIDAAVEYPDGKLPVLRVKPRDITVEEVKAWADILFEGNQAYEPKNVRTKAEIEEKILSLKQDMSDKDKFYEEKGDVWDYYLEMIANLEKEYETAPDSYTRKATDWTFHDNSYYDMDVSLVETSEDQFIDVGKTFELKMETEEGVLNGHQGVLWVNNRNESDFKLHDIRFYYKDDMDILELPESDLSIDDALSMAEDIKVKLGFEDWVLYENSNGDGDRFFFKFAPVYNGLETLVYSSEITMEDSYAANYYYESLEVEVTRGMVMGVHWQSPLEVVNEENSDVATIGFDKAIELFKNHMKSEYTDTKLSDIGANGSDNKVVANDIQLALMRIKIQDNSEEFYLLPVWDFKGEIISDGVSQIKNVDLATINAVDGSVIDVYLGY